MPPRISTTKAGKQAEKGQQASTAASSSSSGTAGAEKRKKSSTPPEAPAPVRARDAAGRPSFPLRPPSVQLYAAVQMAPPEFKPIAPEEVGKVPPKEVRNLYRWTKMYQIPDFVHADIGGPHNLKLRAADGDFVHVHRELIETQQRPPEYWTEQNINNLRQEVASVVDEAREQAKHEKARGKPETWNVPVQDLNFRGLTVRTFARWLYLFKVRKENDQFLPVGETGQLSVYDWTNETIYLYVLAYEMDIEELRERSLWFIVSKINEWNCSFVPSAEATVFAFDRLGGHSGSEEKLLQLLTDIWHDWWRPDDLGRDSTASAMLETWTQETTGSNSEAVKKAVDMILDKRHSTANLETLIQGAAGYNDFNPHLYHGSKNPAVKDGEDLRHICPKCCPKGVKFYTLLPVPPSTARRSPPVDWVEDETRLSVPTASTGPGRRAAVPRRRGSGSQ